MAGAAQARSGDIVALRLSQHGGPGDTYVVGQYDDGDGQHGVEQPRPQNSDDDDGKQQAGQGQYHVHTAHDEHVKDTAYIACRQAERAANEDGQQDYRHANGQ